jgi:hypothetical protein
MSKRSHAPSPRAPRALRSSLVVTLITGIVGCDASAHRDPIDGGADAIGRDGSGPSPTPTPDAGPGRDAARDPDDASATTSWLPTDWPTDMPDPIAAGDRVFALLEGEWRLDFAAGSEDAPCEASDCPGAADGLDPYFPEGFEVDRYRAFVAPPTRLWRHLDDSKSAADASGLALSYGEGTLFIRRALDGALLALRDTGADELDPTAAIDDFWEVAYVDHGDRVQLVLSEAGAPDAQLRIELQHDAIVIESAGFAFRAPRIADTLEDLTLPAEYADLRGSPSPARAIELIERTRASGDVPLGVLAEILLLLGDDSAEVRLAAADFALTVIDWPGFSFPEPIVFDRVLARLMIDPDRTVRLRIARGLRDRWTDTAEGAPVYHCAIDWAARECAREESDPEIAAVCRAVVDLAIAPRGHCPWITST